MREERQARGGLVGEGEAGVAGEGADLGFGELGGDEGGDDVRAGRRPAGRGGRRPRRGPGRRGSCR